MKISTKTDMETNIETDMETGIEMDMSQLLAFRQIIHKWAKLMNDKQFHIRYVIIDFIDRHERSTLPEIAAQLVLPEREVQAAISGLNISGLVRFDKEAEEGSVSLTASGKRMSVLANEERKRWLRRFAAAGLKEEAQQLSLYLNRLLLAFSEKNKQ